MFFKLICGSFDILLKYDGVHKCTEQKETFNKNTINSKFKWWGLLLNVVNINVL